MRRTLDEVYCRQILSTGSHGRWEPDRRLSIGDFGTFRNDVFKRWGSLKEYGYTFTSTPSGPSNESLISDRMVGKGAAATVKASDALDIVLSGGAELTYEVTGANQVLVLMRTGRWRELDDLGALLLQLRDNFEMIPLPGAVVCDVYQTSGAVVGISSRSTRAFKVGVDARGAPSLVSSVGGGGWVQWRDLRSTRRNFSMGGPLPKPGAKRATRYPYAPLFNKVIRTRKEHWGLFGRAELLDPEGNPVTSRIARTDPTDLVYNEKKASISLAEIREMPVSQLFEKVTPELLIEEADAELGEDLSEEEVQAVVAEADLVH